LLEEDKNEKMEKKFIEDAFKSFKIFPSLKILIFKINVTRDRS
jgi:hypothetical protein